MALVRAHTFDNGRTIPKQWSRRSPSLWARSRPGRSKPGCPR